MPIDWIDVKSKYGFTNDHPEVKEIATTYDTELAKIRKEAEESLSRIKLEPAKRIQVDYEDGEFNDILTKMKLDKKDPDVATAIQAYNKSISAIGANSNAAFIKAAAEKDLKKRTALEDAAIKAHQAALIKARTATREVIAKIPSGVLEPAKRIQVDYEDGEFNDILTKLKLEKKYPPVAAAITQYNKAVSAAGANCNAALLKAANEKDESKRDQLEQAAMKTHQAALIKARTETRAVISKVQPPKMAIGGHR